MTNYKSTDVYNYISYLETYLLGDLESFHKVCKDCEEKEREDVLAGLTNTPITSSGTFTTETTMAPVMTISGTKISDPYERSNIPKYFRSTIPHTLTLFSTIDIIGFLIGTGREDETTENFKNFFATLITEEQRPVLIDIYRHGMTHGYFPKLGVGISYHSSNPDSLFYKGTDGVLVLNANKLEELVVRNIKLIKNNELLYSNMESQFQKLMVNYEKKREKIELLKTTL